MSAPSIPNLNSFRREGFRGRGNAQSNSLPQSTLSQQKHANHDAIVQDTDNDAATSRQSAVNAGYLEDPFSTLLHAGRPNSRRLPLMNRGTYVRTTGIDRVVDTFISASTGTRQQIISLGAGSDTRYFRLKQKRRKLNMIYHELDFEANTRRKLNQLRSPTFSTPAKALTGLDMQAENVDPAHDGAVLLSPDYVIHPQDLRKLPRIKEPLPSVDTTLPTLIISECCLVYLPPDDADAVLQYFSDLFPATTPLAIAIYEPVRPHDHFGKRMISNLASRGLQLQTLERYHDLMQQAGRLKSYGFVDTLQPPGGGAAAADVDFIWHKWISSDEKERVEALEWMDEVEEFVLLAKHYCIAWGWRGFAPDSSWSELPCPPA